MHRTCRISFRCGMTDMKDFEFLDHYLQSPSHHLYTQPSIQTISAVYRPAMVWSSFWSIDNICIWCLIDYILSDIIIVHAMITTSYCMSIFFQSLTSNGCCCTANFNSCIEDAYQLLVPEQSLQWYWFQF